MSRRALGVVLTVAVIVGALLINLVISMLGYMNIWQTDTTIDRYLREEKNGDFYTLYTLTTPFKTLIEDSCLPAVDSINASRQEAGKDPLKVNIIFCADRDVVEASDVLRFPLYTALHLQKEFPEYFDVSFVNIQQNPSAVQKYKLTSTSRIYSSNIIFAFDTEFRVQSLNRLFITDTGETTPWAYNGEKIFANNILALTMAEAPIACFLTNHGENTENCKEFRSLVSRAGYIVQDLDLEYDTIPENCRLLISYDPQVDFFAYGSLGETGISEIQKLDEYLDNSYSFMLFINKDTPEFPNLEEYLSEWGIAVARGTDADGVSHNYTIRDPLKRLDDDGYTLIADYAVGGTGADITTDMRISSYPAKVIFSNATAIKLSDTYRFTHVDASTTNDTPAFRYGEYYRNGVTRYFFDVFRGSQSAVAEVGGEQYQVSTEKDPFYLMTLTYENRILQETNYFSQDDRSYICVFGSTDFASDEALSSAAYGNTDVLHATLQAVGREVAPASLDLRAFPKQEIQDSTFTSADAVAFTVCLALIPAVICFGAGIIVTVKRKYK